MRAREETYRLLELALSLASDGVEEAEVGLLGGVLGTTPFSRNRVEASRELSREALAVRLRRDGAVVRSVTGDLSLQGIKEVVGHARSMLQHARSASGAVVIPFPTPQSYADLETSEDDLERMRGLERAAIVARAIFAAMDAELAASGLVAVRRGSIDFDGSVRPYALANTRGLLAYHSEARLRLEVAMRTRRGTVGFAEVEADHLDAIAVDDLIAAARNRALRPGRLRPCKAGSHAVVLEPSAVAKLLWPLAYTCGAACTRSGASFLSDRLGQRIAHDSVTIVDDFAHPLHGAAPFDMEGVARRRVTIIEAGVARGPVFDWSSAALAGVEATGHRLYSQGFGEYEGANCVVFSGGDASLADLIQATRNGLLVSRVADLRLVDARRLRVQGMTRGALLIDNGEVVGPVEDCPFEVEVLSLLAQVEGLASGVWADGMVVPAMRSFGLRTSA